MIRRLVTSRAPTGRLGLYRGHLWLWLNSSRSWPLLEVGEWLRPFLARRLFQLLLLIHLQTQSNHVCPKNGLTLQSNLFEAVVVFSSSSSPFLKPTFFLVSHRSGSDRISIFIWKLNDNTKHITSGICLSQNVINWVFTFRFCLLHQGPPKTNFFDFFGSKIVAGDVFYAIFRPDNLSNDHAVIVTIEVEPTNVKPWRQIVIPGGS